MNRNNSSLALVGCSISYWLNSFLDSSPLTVSNSLRSCCIFCCRRFRLISHFVVQHYPQVGSLNGPHLGWSLFGIVCCHTIFRSFYPFDICAIIVSCSVCVALFSYAQFVVWCLILQMCVCVHRSILVFLNVGTLEPESIFEPNNIVRHHSLALCH